MIPKAMITTRYFNILTQHEIYDLDILEDLKFNVDEEFKKVYQALGFSRNDFFDFKITVHILSNQKVLSTVHKEIYGKPTNAKAIYSHLTRTIYLIEKFTKNEIQHELAHAILHHWTGKKLPRVLDEMIACWVDMKIN